MSNLFNWVEIPVSDMERANPFYQTILGLEQALQERDYGTMLYTILPLEGDGVGGALVQHQHYLPGQGVCAYLVVQGDLNAALAKVEAAGGQVLIPKNPLSDTGTGYIAQFLDSEGNRIGLWSVQ
jgi:predicted enzyme related to lactoylglutathione lyase